MVDFEWLVEGGMRPIPNVVFEWAADLRVDVSRQFQTNILRISS